MQQFSGAVISLKSLNIIYNNINSRNIVFNEKDQLKLVNFNYILKIKNNLNVNNTPYI